MSAVPGGGVRRHRGPLELGDLLCEVRRPVDAGELELEVVAGRGVEVDQAHTEDALEEALVRRDVLQALVRRRVIRAPGDRARRRPLPWRFLSSRGFSARRAPVAPAVPRGHGGSRKPQTGRRQRRGGPRSHWRWRSRVVATRQSRRAPEIHLRAVAAAAVPLRRGWAQIGGRLSPARR